MMISVIIPTYNRNKSLIKTLKAFSSQSYKDFEIIIVDDGSSDGTREAIKSLKLPLKIRYYFQKNSGPASARNLGIKQSKEEIIFFTGDDIIPSVDLLKEHMNFHQKGNENTAVLGYTQWASQIKITPFIRYITDYHFAYAGIDDDHNVDWSYFYTSNVSIKRKLLDEAGLFDEEFPYAAYEDTEIGYRLFQKGMKIVFNRKAIAYHNHAMDFKKYQRTMLYRGKSAVILANKVSQLKRKASYKETNNLIRYLFKKTVVNNFTVPIYTEIICFSDKLFIPLPKLFYMKILDYYRIQGIKKSK